LKIWCNFASDELKAATLTHVLLPKEGSQFVALLASGRRAKGRGFKQKAKPTDVRGGRLRLVRTDTKLSFLVAESGTDTFHEVQTVDVDRDDVCAWRVSANTANDPCGLTVRVTDLAVRAEALSDLQPRTRRGWLVASLVAVVAVLAGGGGLAWWRRRRDARPNPHPHPLPEGEGTK
jgi:hypothetical protein